MSQACNSVAHERDLYLIDLLHWIEGGVLAVLKTSGDALSGFIFPFHLMVLNITLPPCTLFFFRLY